MDKWQAIDNFWNGFGWPAFDENSVPDEIEVDGEIVPLDLPYITYEAAVGRLGDSMFLSASLWDNSTSWARISQKASEIETAINTLDPKAIEIDDGRMWITSSRPFAQRLYGGEDNIKRIRLGIQLEFFTEN